MMHDITFRSRLTAILGMDPDTPEKDIIDRCKALMAENEKFNVLGEREVRLREMESAMNCSREVAVFALSEQERERLHPPLRF